LAPHDLAEQEYRGIECLSLGARAHLTRLRQPIEEGAQFRLPDLRRRSISIPALKPPHPVLFTQQVAEVLADAVAMAQVMMALKQEPQQRGVRRAGTHRFNPQGSSCRQFGRERTFVQSMRHRLTVAVAVDRAPLSRRQPDQPPGLELEQQGAARHVLEPPSALPSEVMIG